MTEQEVVDEFVETSLDPSTFTAGGRTKEFDGKTVVFSNVHVINDLPGKAPEQGEDQREEWALLRLQITEQGVEDAKPEQLEYRFGKTATVRASEDGNKVLTKKDPRTGKGRPLFKELEGAKLLEAIVKAGFDGVEKGGFSSLNGQAFEIAALGEKYIRKSGKDKGKEAEFFRLFPTKYVGAASGSPAAAADAAGLDARMDEVILAELAEAKDNKMTLATLQRSLQAKLPNEKAAVIKRLFNKAEFQARQGTGYVIAKDQTVSLAS